MDVVIAPEPAAWVEQARAEGATILAPWCAGARWLPRVAGAFGARGAGNVDAQRIVGRMRSRAILGAALARRIPRGVTRVLAPSLAAREAFVVALNLGADTCLVEDLPDLAQLQADLDAAARAWPADPFLRNHRASAHWMVRQRAERAAADTAVVRTPWTEARHVAVGRPAVALVAALVAPLEHAPFVIRLAGPALGRAGLHESLVAFAALHRHDPRWTLHVRPVGPLLLPPGVRAAPTRLQAAVVLAPSWVEADLPEVRAAGEAGVPILATARAAGFAPYREVPVGDARALLGALMRVCLSG